MGNRHILEGVDCSRTTRGGKWEQTDEFSVIVGEIHAGRPTDNQRTETCWEQKPGGHPGGGVRGLEGIVTPSSSHGTPLLGV